MKSKYEMLKKQFGEALRRLEEVMQRPKDEFIRDSAIQRFEFTFETMWKTIREYLRKKGAGEVNFPRDVIKEAFKAGLIADDLGWIKMLDSRNLSSHVYNEKIAEEIYGSLKTYIDMMSSLLNKL